jgi:ubiquinone/menaquinone biosynthesis C-methylase UbiE
MSDEWTRHSRRNRRAWNEVADVRAASYEGARDAAFFREGGVSLDGEVREAVGDVLGKRLLHLMCATGEETLSWAVLGASAVGLDISERQIELARDKAEAAGLPVRFVAADVGDLPWEFSKADYDIVYMATGVLVWLPDLDVWARAVARALRPGGGFVLWEEHPIAQVLSADASRQLIVEGDYFAQDPSEFRGMTHFPGGEDASETNVQFSWTMGDVVSSVVAAGLRLERLTEFPGGPRDRWRFGDATDVAVNIPARFVLLAPKDDVIGG